MRQTAQKARCDWRCVLAGYEPGEVGERQQATIKAIQRMTGFDAGVTCPRALLSHPAIIDALRLLPALEHGTLPLMDKLPAVLHEAVYACGEGRGMRYDYENKVREAKAKK